MADEILSREAVNRKRQPEFDLAKAVMACLLAFIHCTIECTSEENLTSGIPYLFDTIIGGPLAAPMFMFSMGVGVAYTRKNSPRELAKRGIRLELAGFALNLCRYTLPYLVGYGLTSDWDVYIKPLLYRTFCNDILQFAGLALLLFALFRQLNGNDALLAVTSVAMSLCGTWLNGLDVGSPPGNIALGYVVGTEDAAGLVFSDFPLLNWFLVPASGYLFGKLLVRVRDKKRFYMRVSPGCLAAAAAWFFYGIRHEIGMFGEGQNCYYHITTGDACISIAAAAGLLGVYFGISKWLPEGCMKWVREISENLTYIYCIHWVMLTMVINVWMYAVRGTQELPVPLTMLLAAAISAAAVLASHVWTGRSRWIQRREKKS